MYLNIFLNKKIFEKTPFLIIIPNKIPIPIILILKKEHSKILSWKMTKKIQLFKVALFKVDNKPKLKFSISKPLQILLIHYNNKIHLLNLI
jgi:hypothetical protein